MTAQPQQLQPVFHERIWGVNDLAPWFPPQPGRIGEVWFNAGADSPLLIKWIFTSDKLSVQVHPGDDYARRLHGGRGKTEMWHILAAEPDARIALGLRETMDRSRLREVALSGELEDLLTWVPVHPGETYFVPAGAIHAIGGGLTLCEIQQNSDITYRLYDYGRPRELHLDHALAVSEPAPYEGRRDLPVRSEQFLTEELRWDDHEEHYRADGMPAHWLLVLAGEGSMAGLAFRPGQVWQLPPEAKVDLRLEKPIRLLRTSVPTPLQHQP